MIVIGSNSIFGCDEDSVRVREAAALRSLEVGTRGKTRRGRRSLKSRGHLSRDRSFDRRGARLDLGPKSSQSFTLGADLSQPDSDFTSLGRLRAGISAIGDGGASASGARLLHSVLGGVVAGLEATTGSTGVGGRDASDELPLALRSARAARRSRTRASSRRTRACAARCRASASSEFAASSSDEEVTTMSP